jgi:hypothetical protein
VSKFAKREKERQAIVKKLFPELCEQSGLPRPVPEYRFAPPRRWKMDYCFPQDMLAVECEGGVWTNGRHVRGSGFVKDMEKYNTAAAMGYRIIRVTPQQLGESETIDLIRRALAA